MSLRTTPIPSSLPDAAAARSRWRSPGLWSPLPWGHWCWPADTSFKPPSLLGRERGLRSAAALRAGGEGVRVLDGREGLALRVEVLADVAGLGVRHLDQHLDVGQAAGKDPEAVEAYAGVEHLDSQLGVV